MPLICAASARAAGTLLRHVFTLGKLFTQRVIVFQVELISGIRISRRSELNCARLCFSGICFQVDERISSWRQLLARLCFDCSCRSRLPAPLTPNPAGSSNAVSPTATKTSAATLTHQPASGLPRRWRLVDCNSGSTAGEMSAALEHALAVRQ